MNAHRSRSPAVSEFTFSDLLQLHTLIKESSVLNPHCLCKETNLPLKSYYVMTFHVVGQQ